MPIMPFCPGTLCPIKSTCAHFKEQIDRKKDIYFDSAPYNHRLKKCEFYPRKKKINFRDAPANGDE